MRIDVIQASNQKIRLLYDAVCTYANKDLVIHFGCDRNEEINFSYSEVSVMIALLLASLAVDFVVTGCSSGQGTDQQGIIQKEYILSHGKRGENSILDESLCRQGIKALIRGAYVEYIIFYHQPDSFNRNLSVIQKPQECIRGI